MNRWLFGRIGAVVGLWSAAAWGGALPVAFSSVSTATPDDAPQPKGARLLGINVNEAEDQNFDRAFRTGWEAGLQVVSLKLDWDDLEKQPGEYASPFPAIADLFYSAAQVKLSLRIATLDTSRNRIPADLRAKPFDDPTVIQRFNALVDWLAQQMPKVEIEDFSIGNEVDAFLGSDAAKWRQYTAFFQATREHVKQTWPQTQVGSSLTFGGHTGPAKEQVLALNRHADVVMVSYYPLNADLRFRDPSVVGGDFQAVCAQYPGRSITFTECGYASGTKCGASEEKQKRFVEEVFRAWDAHADQVGQVMFVWLHDQPPETVRWTEEYYGVRSDAFADFIGTLGLRTYPGSGEDKPAFVALKAEAQKRGWGGAICGPNGWR